jgi:hypothetical protein
LTIDPIELAAQSMKRQFERQSRDGTFPSIHGMLELANFAKQCRASSSERHAIVAFILEKIFTGWGSDWDGRPVTRTEAEALRNKILDPTTRAIEVLNGSQDDPINIGADLVRVSP